MEGSQRVFLRHSQNTLIQTARNENGRQFDGVIEASGRTARPCRTITVSRFEIETNTRQLPEEPGGF